MFESLRSQIEGRPTLPDEYQCDDCRYVRLSPESLAWMLEAMPHNVDQTGDEPRLSDWVRCRCESRSERYAREYQSGRALRFYRSGLPSRQIAGAKTFDAWSPVEGADKAYRACRAWAVGDGPPFLVMLGRQGSGKTHLAEAATLEALERDKSAQYIVAGDLMDDLRRRFNRPADDGRIFEEQLEHLGTIENLIIDDLGQKSSSIWALGQIVSIIDRRYRDECRTLIASNKIDPDGIASWARAGVAQYDAGEADESAARLSSRIFDRNSGVVQTVWVSAPDYRTERR